MGRRLLLLRSLVLREMGQSCLDWGMEGSTGEAVPTGEAAVHRTLFASVVQETPPTLAHAVPST